MNRHQVTATDGQVHTITTAPVVAGMHEGDRELTCDRCGAIGTAGRRSGGTVTQAVEAHRVAVNLTDADHDHAAAIIAALTS